MVDFKFRYKISRMTETVEYVDRWTSINGASRTAPLKNPRKITSLEIFLPDDVYQRVRRMKMPLELVNFEKEKWYFIAVMDHPSPSAAILER